MSINARNANTGRTRRLGFLMLATVGTLLVALNCVQPAQAQCSGSAGGGAGGRTPPAGTGGFAAGGTLANGANNLAQLQQMAALVQQQAMVQQQQQMTLLQRRQEMAAAQQRQPRTAQAKKLEQSRAPAPYTFVEAAQRRRAAYLRVKRQQNANELLLVSTNRNE